MVQGLYGECVEIHRVYVSDRGGNRRIAELTNLSQVRWNRLRDDTSEATVVIAGQACEAQAATLATIEPKRHELVIYRGEDRVWEGPIVLLGYHDDYVEITAHDVSEYIFGRPLSIAWDNSYNSDDGVTEVTTRMEKILKYELSHSYTYEDDDGNARSLPAWEAISPPANIRPHLVVHHFPGEVRTSASTTPFQMTVGEHLDNYARTGGIDYTTIGRAIHVWDTSNPIGQTRTLTEADFFNEIITSFYGSDYASVAFATAQDGRYGGAGGVKTDWRWLEKTRDPSATLLDLEPEGSDPLGPSLAYLEAGQWSGYRYWMGYRPSGGSSRIRVAGSNDLETWNDLKNADVDDNDDGTGLSALDPAIAFAYSDHLWLFYVASGQLWRTRSLDGISWTTPVSILTASIRCPSPSYNPESEKWVMYAVSTASSPYVIRRYVSKGKELTASDAFTGSVKTCTLNNAPSGKHPWKITAHRQGSYWHALITFTDSGTTSNGLIYAARAPTSNPTVFTVASSPIVQQSGYNYGRGDWVFDPDGDMPLVYARATTGWAIALSELVGPDPVVLAGDQNIDYYGPWTKIFTVYDEDATTPPTQADLNSQARRNLVGRSPVPVEVRVPDNSGIRLSADLSIHHLVPGVYMPLRALMNTRPLSQMQKLDKVTVTETSDGETIQVTLVPATSSDAVEETT